MGVRIDSNVLSKEEVEGLRAAVRGMKSDVLHVYAKMTPREKLLGVRAISRRLLQAAMAKLEDEGELDDQAIAAQVRTELERVLLGLLEEEFDVDLGQP